MSYTLTTSGAIMIKAGKNRSADISGADLSLLSDWAEAFIFTSTRKDRVTDYTTVNTNAKATLSDVASSYAAKIWIEYDMSGYTSRSEAQTMLDVLDDNIKAGLSILTAKENTEKFI